MDIQIFIAQKNRAPLDVIAEVYGGHVSVRQNYPVATWCCPSPKIKEFLLDILPYLIVKKEQAELALEYIALGRAKHASRHNPNENDELWEKRAAVSAQIKAAKAIEVLAC